MLLTLFILLMGFCLAAPDQVNNIDDLVSSLTYPGVTFRRAPVRKFNNFQKQKFQSGSFNITRVSSTKHAGHMSVASRLAALHLDQNEEGFGNVSVVDRKANQYSVDVLLNGSPMKLLIDSGSSDTWIRGVNFTCSNPNVTGSACGLGPAYPELDFPGGHITGQHFYISPNDNETVAGLLGYMDIEVAGITVHRQEIGMASVGSWNGDNVTSGVLGLAYPSLTSAYYGDDLTSNSPDDMIMYSPVFTSMMTGDQVESYWCLSLDRNSTSGSVSFGEMPPVNVSHANHAETHLIIVSTLAHH